MTSLNFQNLPDDIEALKEIISQAQSVIQESEDSLSQKDKEIESLKVLNQGLQYQLEKHLRSRFGQTSEKGLPNQKDQPGQMWLFKKDELQYFFKLFSN